VTTGELQVAAARQATSTARVVGWLCAAVLILRSTYVLMPLRSDEGGYLFVARQWHSGGEFLYGDYYVDRPPLLLALFRLAATTDWDGAIRVLSIPFAVLFVVAAARAGHLAAGPRAARWSALVAAGLMASPAVGADQADGELFAAPLVMCSVALLLDAWRRSPGRAQLWLAVAGGVAASAASLVKQNFLEGFVFVIGLVVADAVRRRSVGERSKVVLLGTVLGGAVPNVLVYVWASASGVDGLRIWQDVAAFRGDAFEVIWGHSTTAPVTRGLTLLLLALVSGVVPVIAAWVLAWREGALLGREETWAIAGALAFGLAAIAAGGSYWAHYLLQLAPMVSLAAGVVVAAGLRSGRRMRRWSVLVPASAVLGSVLVGLVYLTVPAVWFQERTGQWLASSSRPGDSAVVAYGNPAILEAADLPSPYPHLWSLPMRTLDPDQTRLRAALAGPDAPSWMVEVTPLNSWGIDDDYRLRSLIEERYRVVATVCGRDVWLRADLSRDLAPLPRC
jgi:hypothetical protein